MRDFLPRSDSAYRESEPLRRDWDRAAALSVQPDLGCKFTRPHLIPLFLPFLALPSIRILSGGIVDVKKRSYIQPIN